MIWLNLVISDSLPTDKIMSWCAEDVNTHRYEENVYDNNHKDN